MDKAQSAAVLVLVLALVFTTRFSIANNNRERNNVVDEEEEQSKITPMWWFHRLRNAYSLYSTLFYPTKYWHLFKAILNQTYTYFFPPNIDFRRGNEVEDRGGAGEKVKEALAKSLGTSKATLEDAAKSAADIAGETIHKVKKTLSDNDDKEEIKAAKKEL